MDTTVYARVENNRIVEYPVLELHIRNRAHPFDWYTPVDYAEKPDISPYELLVEHPTITGPNQILVTYTVVKAPLDRLLSIFWTGVAEGEHPDISRAKPELVHAITTAIDGYVQARLDDFAATKGYNGILGACSYVNSTNATFAQDAKTASVLRDESWVNIIQYQTDVTNGRQSIVRTAHELDQYLPVLTWD